MAEPGSEESVEMRLARLERELAELRASKELREASATGRFVRASVDLDGGAFSAKRPSVIKHLSEPPRRVPIAFRLAGLSWKWWEAFAVLMTLTTPLAVWLFWPSTLPIPFIVLLLGAAIFRSRSVGIRTSVLKWGKVATVTAVNTASVGTYFSGTTYNNIRLAQATGWTVERQWYSGPGHTTDIEYTVDGASGMMRMHGLPYTSGVIIASTKDPSKALCVSDFPYDLDVDSNGDWVSTVRPGLWLGACATVTMYAALVCGAVISVRHAWF